MKKILMQPGLHLIGPCILCMLMCSCTVAAYELSIATPTSLAQGTPLLVTGTTNLPPAISIDVVLYLEEDTADEVARKTLTLQGTPEFSVVFDTSSLPIGLYKVEVPGFPGFPFLGNSISAQHVQILPASANPTVTISPTVSETPSDEIIIGTVPVTQTIVGNLAVNATPAGAVAVLDDGEFLETPCIFRNVARGYHSLAVRHPDYETTKTTVFVSGGETTRVFVSLVPLPMLPTTPTQTVTPDTGTAYISSEPQGAEVSLDSIFRGTTPMMVMEIEKGIHTIVITREGYEPWQTEITVQNASNHSIDARLVPAVKVTTTTTRMASTISLGIAFFGSLMMVYLWRKREG